MVSEDVFILQNSYSFILHRYWEGHNNSTEAKKGMIASKSSIFESCGLSLPSATDDSCFQVEGVCDVVLYLGTVQTELVPLSSILLWLICSVREVWHAPLWLHHMLCCAKLLGENTLEAFLDRQAYKPILL